MGVNKEAFRQKAEAFRAISKLLDEDDIKLSQNHINKMLCDGIAEICDALTK